MREDGIVGLPDPSGLFLSDRPSGVAGTCVGVVLEGRRPMVTEIQALASPSAAGSPRRSFNGLDNSRVSMVLAVLARHCDVKLADHDVYASTVGGIAATEPAADLAVALAIASDARNKPLAPGLCAIGEVSLSGDVRRVNGLERRLADAARLGFHTAFVPGAARSVRGSDPLPDVAGIKAIAVSTLNEAVSLALSGDLVCDEGRRPSLRVVAPSTRGCGRRLVDGGDDPVEHIGAALAALALPSVGDTH
jgi:DNA repair protein RadA/Sms